MVTVTGTCKYCGQLKTFEAPDSIAEDQDKIDEEVSNKCNCEAAREEARKSNAQFRAEKYIDKYFKGETAELAKRAVPLIIRNEIDSLTINAGLGEKLVLRASLKKLIIAKYSITKQTSMEE